MRTTMHAAALVAVGALAALAACNKTSASPPMVTAPVGSGAPQATTPPVASTPPASSDESMLGPGPADDNAADAGNAQYRACQQDADCTAVPRVGCCNNGWLEAVNVGQKDAYAKSFTCPQPRPMCPMYMVHDTRTPRCDPGTHLCTMVNAHP
ncbi:MAG TPA: hypothetical protein VF765_00235 [Polyangiaceae bacterium]